MTKFYVSNEATNGYVIGDDSNDGLTKNTPWLTANKALTTGLDADNEVMFNDGKYTYSANNGKITSRLTNFQITFENDYVTVIEFEGTSLQGVHLDGSSTEDRELYIGKCYFTYTGTGFSIPVYISQPAAGADVIFRSGVRHVPTLGRDDHYFVKHQFRQGLIDIFDGGVCAPDGGLLDLGTQTMGSLFSQNAVSDYAQHNIRVKSWYFNVRASVIHSRGPLYFYYLNPPQSGHVEVGGVHGVFINTAIEGSGYIARLLACPSGSKLLPSHNLTVVNENFDAFMTAANIAAPVSSWAGAARCDNALISGWKNIRMFCDQGFTAVMGVEGEDSAMANSMIIDCEFDVYVSDPDRATIHGITHTNTGDGGGLRSGNICNGAAIASLTKNSNAISTGNRYARTINTGLYGKGALKGALFSKETFVVGPNSSAPVELTFKDGVNLGTGCDFEDTLVIAPLGGSFDSNTNVVVIGSSADESVGNTKRLRISENIVTGAEFGQFYTDQTGVSLETWNQTGADPKAKRLKSQHISLLVDNVTAKLTGLHYEILDSAYRPLFKGDGLILDKDGKANIFVEGLGLENGETVYYRISNHDVRTNVASNIGAGRTVVRAY